MCIDIIKHFERHLGPIQHGWNSKLDGWHAPFQVIQMGGGSIKGAKVLVTLGLSNYSLSINDKSTHLRQELMFMFYEEDGPRNLPAVLQQVGLEALSRDKAYSLGEVLGPRGELTTGSELEALFITQPVYLPDSFHVFRPVGDEPIVIGWLVPITVSEAAYIKIHGRLSFEDKLELFDPDLLNFNRKAIL